MMISEAAQVRPFTEADAEAWDAYVLAHGDGTLFHRLAWSRAVEAAYHHQPMHLTAWAGERLVGVLPLFFVRSVFVGRVLVSVPYGTYGGILADGEGAARALLAAAEDACRQTRAEYIELRHREPNALGLSEITRYDTFRKQLPREADKILSWLPRKTRAATRKGLNLVTVEFGPHLMDDIYALYAYTLRRLGSPNYSRAFFRELQRTHGDDCICQVVRDRDGRTVLAGLVSFVFRDEVIPYFTGSRPEGTHKFANNVLHLRLMEWAVQHGLRWYDFNRSRRDNHGPHAFKRYHGFEPEPLHYQISLNRAKTLPNLSPSNRKFAVAGRLWRSMPLWFTRLAGARITKWIP